MCAAFWGALVRDDLHQLEVVEGFQNHGSHAGLNARQACFIASIRCDADHNRLCATEGFNLLTEQSGCLVTIHFGHKHVHQYNRGMVLLNQFG